MMMNWLRENKYAAGLLLFIRLYLGWEWLTGGWGKLTGPKPFDATGFLNGAITKPVAKAGEVIYPNFTAFLQDFALPNVKLFNVLVPWGEFLVGLGLLLGALTTVAMFFGLVMNFMFLYAGTVSVNPWMIMFGFIILAAGANAGKYGVDYILLPILKKWFGRGENQHGEIKQHR